MAGFRFASHSAINFFSDLEHFVSYLSRFAVLHRNEDPPSGEQKSK